MSKKKEFAAYVLEEKFAGKVINQKSMEERFVINVPKYLLIKNIVKNIDETISFLEEIKKINEGEITHEEKEKNEKM